MLYHINSTRSRVDGITQPLLQSWWCACVCVRELLILFPSKYQSSVRWPLAAMTQEHMRQCNRRTNRHTRTPTRQLSTYLPSAFLCFCLFSQFNTHAYFACACANECECVGVLSVAPLARSNRNAPGFLMGAIWPIKSQYMEWCSRAPRSHHEYIAGLPDSTKKPRRQTHAVCCRSAATFSPFRVHIAIILRHRRRRCSHSCGAMAIVGSRRVKCAVRSTWRAARRDTQRWWAYLVSRSMCCLRNQINLYISYSDHGYDVKRVFQQKLFTNIPTGTRTENDKHTAQINKYITLESWITKTSECLSTFTHTPRLKPPRNKQPPCCDHFNISTRSAHFLWSARTQSICYTTISSSASHPAAILRMMPTPRWCERCTRHTRKNDVGTTNFDDHPTSDQNHIDGTIIMVFR